MVCMFYFFKHVQKRKRAKIGESLFYVLPDFSSFIREEYPKLSISIDLHQFRKGYGTITKLDSHPILYPSFKRNVRAIRNFLA